jgi:hypothetical protein
LTSWWWRSRKPGYVGGDIELFYWLAVAREEIPRSYHRTRCDRRVSPIKESTALVNKKVRFFTRSQHPRIQESKDPSHLSISPDLTLLQAHSLTCVQFNDILDRLIGKKRLVTSGVDTVTMCVWIRICGVHFSCHA